VQHTTADACCLSLHLVTPGHIRQPWRMSGQAQNRDGACLGKRSTCSIDISPAQVRRVVPVDGVSDNTGASPAAAFAALGGGGGRKALLPLLKSLTALQELALLLAVVTVRPALGSDTWAGAQASTVLLLPLRSEPLVTTASEPVRPHPLASGAALSGSAASRPPDVGVFGRQQSAAGSVPMCAGSAAEPCTEGQASLWAAPCCLSGKPQTVWTKGY
jgi:hypothetical protein